MQRDTTKHNKTLNLPIDTRKHVKKHGERIGKLLIDAAMNIRKKK